MSCVTTIWIDHGAPVPGLDRNPFPNLDMPFRYYGLIEVTNSTWGTAIRWDPLHVKEMSIQDVIGRLCDRLCEWVGPYTLVYFKQGWFKETFQSSAQAANRILHIQSLDNVQILNSALFKNFPINSQTVLPWLRSAYHDPEAYRDHCVEDMLDDNEGTFQLESVGKNSLFREYICMEQDNKTCVRPGNERWIREVESVYVDVLKDWQPRLDHVVASLVLKEEEPMWRSWHRLVMPVKSDDGRFGVQCFVAKAPADIFVI